MAINFTEEQSMLRDSLASYLADHYAFEARRAAVRSADGWRPAIWKGFAHDLGLLGATFGEDLGGLGGGAVETMIIAEELGRALVVEPYLGTVVIGGGFLKHGGSARAAELIGAIIAGEAILAFAHAEPQGRYNLADLATTAARQGAGWMLNGHKAVVIGAPWATHLIVTARTGGARRDADGVSVFLVDAQAPGVRRQDYATIDGQRAAEIWLENVSVPADALIGPEGQSLPLVRKVVDEALTALAAEACGVLGRMQEMTVDYTRQRRQFGQPIAGFQVLQHRMVDMAICLEQAVCLTRTATLAMDADDATRSKAASAAKVLAGQACVFVGQNAIQLHGGMGTTDELAVGHYFKRATVIESQFGSTDHHLARYESLSFGEAA